MDESEGDSEDLDVVLTTTAIIEGDEDVLSALSPPVLPVPIVVV